MSIPSQIIDEVRERCSLVELIGETVALKQMGRLHKGLCPFHSEKTPSFCVNDEDGTFHCFGCGKHGSAFDFLMETKGYTFPEAVRFLAGRLGIQIPESGGAEREEDKERRQTTATLRTLSHLVSQECSKFLFTDEVGRSARQYLQQRGITGEVASEFSLGYVPARWELLQERVLAAAKENRSLDFDEAQLSDFLLQLGVLREKTGKANPAQLYSPFFDRVLFPITRSDGQAIAFGGRIFNGETERPKYINSPESPIYLKRKTFFGMAQVLPSIRRENLVYIVEGYLDVISLYQAGFRNCLATCGTAVTPDHARVLSRLVSEVVVVFDGDEAGQRAAAKCFDVFVNSGIEVNAVLLPDGQDPDSLAQQKTPDEVRDIFRQQRVPLVDVYLSHLLKGDAEESSAAALGRASSVFAKQLLRFQNPVERESLTRRAAEKFGVSIDALTALIAQEEQKMRPSSEPYPTESAQSFVSKQRHEQPRFVNRAQQNFDSQAPTAAPYHNRPAKAAVLDERGMLQAYYLQLLVAVVTEPQLAATVLALPSLTEGSEVAPRIPENLRGFFEAVSTLSIMGLGDPELPQIPLRQQQEILATYEKLLAEHGLEHYRAPTEALRQRSIGGGKPAAVVADALRTTGRASILGQVQQIRREEAGEMDDSRRVQLAQEKLRQKRSLEQLKGGLPKAS